MIIGSDDIPLKDPIHQIENAYKELAYLIDQANRMEQALQSVEVNEFSLRETIVRFFDRGMAEVKVQEQFANPMVQQAKRHAAEVVGLINLEATVRKDILKIYRTASAHLAAQEEETCSYMNLMSGL